VRVWTEKDEKRGIRGTHFHVEIYGEEEGHGEGHHRHHHTHTSVSEILERIEGLEIPEPVKKDALYLPQSFAISRPS
jgi:uncharacterized protein (DUF111 family)